MSTSANACGRCSSDLDSSARCVDETCPFSTHAQTCATGWSGHPERDPHPNDDAKALVCSCGGNPNLEVKHLDAYVFLEDGKTFSPLHGATILLGTHDRQFDLAKLFAIATPDMLAAASVPVNNDSVSEVMAF